MESWDHSHIDPEVLIDRNEKYRKETGIFKLGSYALCQKAGKKDEDRLVFLFTIVYMIYIYIRASIFMKLLLIYVIFIHILERLGLSQMGKGYSLY